jgi:hypothetical protein
MQLAEMVQAMRLDLVAVMKVAPGWLGKMPSRGLEKLRWWFLAEGLVRPLVAWWLKLGIRHERIEPGKPQQNGRHERMHLTLKQQTALPPASSMRAA